MDVEIFTLLGEMLFHRARHVGGVAQDDFAGFRREFWVLAHGVGDDGEGELVMFRDPVNGSGFAPGASQVRPSRVFSLQGALADPILWQVAHPCLLYTSPSPRDGLLSRMPSSA